MILPASTSGASGTASLKDFFDVEGGGLDPCSSFIQSGLSLVFDSNPIPNKLDTNKLEIQV